MTKVLVNYLKRKDSIELRFDDHVFIDRPVIIAELDHEYTDPIITQNGAYLEIFEKAEYEKLQAETVKKLRESVKDDTTKSFVELAMDKDGVHLVKDETKPTVWQGILMNDIKIEDLRLKDGQLSLVEAAPQK